MSAGAGAGVSEGKGELSAPLPSSETMIWFVDDAVSKRIAKAKSLASVGVRVNVIAAVDPQTKTPMFGIHHS